jgi:hypothetical protein
MKFLKITIFIKFLKVDHLLSERLGTRTVSNLQFWGLFACIVHNEIFGECVMVNLDCQLGWMDSSLDG